MVKKQLKQAGCLIWAECSATDIVLLGDAVPKHVLPKLVQVWLYTSDCGPDVKLMRRSMCNFIDQMPHDLWFDLDCFMHQAQLATKGGIMIMDACLLNLKVTWKYWASIAKLIHVWRDNARPLFRAWTTLHGPESAVAHVKRLPPRPISGRWMSANGCEKAIQAGGRNGEALIQCLDAILDKNSAAAEQVALILKNDLDYREPLPVMSKVDAIPHAIATAPDEGAAALVELHMDDNMQYRLKMGRWRRDVMTTIHDAIFFPTIDIASSTREGLTHLMCFVQQPVPDHMLEQGGHVAWLHDTKGHEIQEHHTKLLTRSWATTLETVPVHLKPGLLSMTLKCVLHNAASYDRRVLAQLYRCIVELQFAPYFVETCLCDARRTSMHMTICERFAHCVASFTCLLYFCVA